MYSDHLKDSPVGSLVPVSGDALAYVPNPLPRSIPLDDSLIYLLDRASLATATLAGLGEALPNPRLLIEPFLRREAVLSSRIEGTQTSVSDLMLYEASKGRQNRAGDAHEVLNYVLASEFGLGLLAELPLCTRFFNEMHAVLMQGVRGGEQRPGELRDIQVHIGNPGSTITEATFVPPPPALVPELLADLDTYINSDAPVPPLIRSALVHYQFETIHPYRDGNGRMGRLLIVLMLCSRGVLTTPLLYLSAYFERHRGRYYELLFNVSATGDWAAWIEFFLTGVLEQADDAVRRSRSIRALHDNYRHLPTGKRDSANVLRLIDELFVRPAMTAPEAAEFMGISSQGARGVFDRLASAGIVEVLPNSWPTLYVARELIALIEAPTA